MPALLTIQSGINQLRYATLKGIMAAKKKEIRKVTPAAPAEPTQRSDCAVPEKAKADPDDLRHRRPKRRRSW